MFCFSKVYFGLSQLAHRLTKNSPTTREHYSDEVILVYVFCCTYCFFFVATHKSQIINEYQITMFTKLYIKNSVYLTKNNLKLLYKIIL